MKKWFIGIVGRLNRWLTQILQNENEKDFRKQLKKLDERRLEAAKAERAKCPHIAGSNLLSECQDWYKRTSIVWHRLNTGEEVGLCTNCFRNFFPSDPDYTAWRKKTSFNRRSAAGDRENLLRRNIKAEPFLCRLVDPPPPTAIEVPKYKKEPDTDPWLLNEDGSLDELAIAAVDFEVVQREKTEGTNESL